MSKRLQTLILGALILFSLAPSQGQAMRLGYSHPVAKAIRRLMRDLEQLDRICELRKNGDLSEELRKAIVLLIYSIDGTGNGFLFEADQKMQNLKTVFHDLKKNGKDIPKKGPCRVLFRKFFQNQNWEVVGNELQDPKMKMEIPTKQIPNPVWVGLGASLLRGLQELQGWHGWEKLSDPARWKMAVSRRLGMASGTLIFYIGPTDPSLMIRHLAPFDNFNLEELSEPQASLSEEWQCWPEADGAAYCEPTENLELALDCIQDEEQILCTGDELEVALIPSNS